MDCVSQSDMFIYFLCHQLLRLEVHREEPIRYSIHCYILLVSRYISPPHTISSDINIKSQWSFNLSCNGNMISLTSGVSICVIVYHGSKDINSDTMKCTICKHWFDELVVCPSPIQGIPHNNFIRWVLCWELMHQTYIPMSNCLESNPSPKVMNLPLKYSGDSILLGSLPSISTHVTHHGTIQIPTIHPYCCVTAGMCHHEVFDHCHRLCQYPFRSTVIGFALDWSICVSVWSGRSSWVMTGRFHTLLSSCGRRLTIGWPVQCIWSRSPFSHVRRALPLPVPFQLAILVTNIRTFCPRPYGCLIMDSNLNDKITMTSALRNAIALLTWINWRIYC